MLKFVYGVLSSEFRNNFPNVDRDFVVNVYEYDDKIGVVAEIPGLDKKDLSVEVEDGGDGIGIIDSTIEGGGEAGPETSLETGQSMNIGVQNFAKFAYQIEAKVKDRTTAATIVTEMHRVLNTKATFRITLSEVGKVDIVVQERSKINMGHSHAGTIFESYLGYGK